MFSLKLKTSPQGGDEKENDVVGSSGDEAVQGHTTGIIW